MRIGLVTPYTWTVPGGVNQHVEHLAAELEARGHEPWIMAPVGAYAPSWRRPDGRRLPKAAENLIPMGTGFGIPTNGSHAYISLNPRVLWRMDNALRRMQFDLLHVHEPCTPMVAGAAVLLATSPVVGTFHAALDSSRAYATMDGTCRQVVERLDVRIAVSEAAQAYPGRLFPGEFRIVPNGVDVEAFARAVGRERVQGRICFIGRADRRKGLGVLLEAFAELRRRRPHVSLTIIGATRRQILEVLRVGPARQIDFDGIETTGWITDDEKVDRLAQAQVVCAPSLAAESFGIVLAEAMAAGVPVVASDLPGYRAVLRDGRAGRLVPPNDGPRLADALDDVLRDPHQRARLAEAGLVAARQLSWTHVTQQILTAYDDALALGVRPYAKGSSGKAWLGRAILGCFPPGRAGAVERAADLPVPGEPPSPIRRSREDVRSAVA
jgi:phosphatidylinositol alpha-mannosyltransferase